MTIANRRQLENTRAKLRELEELLATAHQGPTDNERARERTLRSLGTLIKQLKEEIIRFQVRVSSRVEGPGTNEGVVAEAPSPFPQAE